MYKRFITNVVFSGVDPKDHPYYANAYVESADYNHVPMNETELDELNENSELVHELLIESL